MNRDCCLAYIHKNRCAIDSVRGRWKTSSAEKKWKENCVSGIKNVCSSGEMWKKKAKRQQFLRSNQSKSNFLPKALARSRSLVTYAKLTKSREIKKSYIYIYTDVAGASYANWYVTFWRANPKNQQKLRMVAAILLYTYIYIFYICLIRALFAIQLVFRCCFFSFFHSLLCAT